MKRVVKNIKIVKRSCSLNIYVDTTEYKRCPINYWENGTFNLISNYGDLSSVSKKTGTKRSSIFFFFFETDVSNFL